MCDCACCCGEVWGVCSDVVAVWVNSVRGGMILARVG